MLVAPLPKLLFLLQHAAKEQKVPTVPLLVVGYGDSETGCRNTSAVQLSCTVDGSHPLLGIGCVVVPLSYHVFEGLNSHNCFFLFSFIHSFLFEVPAVPTQQPVTIEKLLLGGPLAGALRPKLPHLQRERLTVLRTRRLDMLLPHSDPHFYPPM